jgi:hypothetical protein
VKLAAVCFVPFLSGNHSSATRIACRHGGCRSAAGFQLHINISKQGVQYV